MDRERILIVEDEKIIALDLQRRLERLGYTVAGLAVDADQAMEFVEQELPDLILMDIMLPGSCDGIVAATEIRERFRIPVVFLTAYADESTLQRAKIAEPAGYILKPFKEQELHTTIDIGLYKSRVEREIVRQQRLFSAILHSAGDGIIATDAAGIIQYINPVAVTLTGWHVDEARGTPVDEVVRLSNERTNEPVLLSRSSPERIRGTRQFESVALHNRYGARVLIEGTASDIRGDRGDFEGLTLAFRDVTDYRKLHETVSYQASHDSLTGLVNRDEFASRLQKLVDETKQNGSTHVFVFVDIDQFKVVNDVCGHQAGDELLRQVAERITTSVDGDAIVGRLGGDQFGLVAIGAAQPDAERIGRDMVGLLNQRFVWNESAFNVTVSVGVSPISSATGDVSDVLAAADDACVLAKEHGGNTFRLYETSDFVFLKRRGEMQWIGRLTQAIEEDRFVFYHQVVQSLRHPLDSKHEILLRLRDSDGGLVSPGEFIVAAERYKLMPSIDRWVVARSCRYVRHAQERGITVPVICVNLSGASLADPTMLDFILENIDMHEVDGARFCFEVTETSAIQNFSHAVDFISRVKETGATFALDDFGNGFSSFSYLKRLPVDFLKIDGSFVKDIENDRIDLAMVEAVNAIGHTMGMRTIAEYVHNERIKEMVTAIGVDYAQGYVIGKPAPLPMAEELIATT